MGPIPLLESKPRTEVSRSGQQRLASVDEVAGGLFLLDITATPNNAEKLVLSIEAWDPVSKKWATVVKFPATKEASGFGAAPTTATLAFIVYPAALEKNTAAEVAAVSLPPVWRAVVTPSGGGSWAYSLSYASLA